MPHYDYVCTDCGHTEERLQKMTDSSVIACPQCQQHAFKRKFAGGIGLQFQGSGFYETDYGSKKQPNTTLTQNSNGNCGCGKSSCSK